MIYMCFNATALTIRAFILCKITLYFDRELREGHQQLPEERVQLDKRHNTL